MVARNESYDNVVTSKQIDIELFDSIEKRIDKVELDVAVLKTDFTLLKKELEGEIDITKEKVKDLEGKVILTQKFVKSNNSSDGLKADLKVDFKDILDLTLKNGKYY